MRRELLPDDHPDIATSSLNLANSLTAQGRYSEAEPLFDGALSALRAKLGDGAVDVIAAAAATADFLLARSDYAAAEPLYREALAGLRRIYGDTDRAVFHNRYSLALVLSRLGQSFEAEMLYREILGAAEQIGLNETETGVVLNNLGLVLREKGDYAGAEPVFQEALAVYRKYPKPNQAYIAATLANLGSVYYETRELDRAESILREADAMQVEIGQGFAASIRSAAFNLAGVLFAQGRHDEALAMLQDVTEIRRKAGAESQHFLNGLILQAKFLAEMDRTEEARQLYLRAQEGYEKAYGPIHYRTITAELALAGLLRSNGDLAGAEASYIRAIEGAEQLRTRIVGEELDRAAFSHVIKLGDIGASYADLLIHLSRYEEALEVVERTRGRALLDLLTRSQTDLIAIARQSDDPQAVLSLEDALASESRARLAANEAEARFARAEASRATPPPKKAAQFEALRQSRLALADAEATVLAGIRELFPDEQPEAPAAIIEALETGDRMVILNWTKQHVSVLLVSPSPDSFRAWQLTRDEEATKALTDLAAQVRDDLSKPPPSQDAIPLRMDRRTALAGRLLPPDLREVLGASERLIVIPHGPLRAIPIETLLQGAGEAARSPSVVYADSGSLYVSQVRRGKMQQQANAALPLSAMLIGDPDFAGPRTGTAERGPSSAAGANASMDRPAVNLSPVDQVRLLGAGLEPLPGTRLEVEAIERALRGADADVLVLTGSDAQAGNLYRDAIDKRFLHLATHGYAGSFEQPDAGALALAAPPAGSSTDNGFLTLDDLVRTWRGRLTNCELVVLSACETQKGADRGDAVMALPWGFMYAGAPSVVASLWKVDDRATALLMPRFYENIVGQYEDSRLGKPPGTSMSKAEGLQEAKIWLVSLGRQTSAQLQARGGMATSHVRPAESDQIVDFSDPYYWAGFVLLGDPD